jgi:hypothetical protein
MTTLKEFTEKLHGSWETLRKIYKEYNRQMNNKVQIARKLYCSKRRWNNANLAKTMSDKLKRNV